MSLPSIAVPGTLLGPSSKYLPGPGTHIHDSQIYASIAGPVASSTPRAPPSTNTTTSTSTTNSKPKLLPLLSISRSATPPSPSPSSIPTTILPEVESIVLARITRLTPRFANAEILVVSDTVCREPFSSIIRREDIRATEKDKVKMEESFRVGDLVRAQVISLGDQSNYYLSTARNERGFQAVK
ncbi:hypothetical protein CC80DRAFT_37893 [Byssothecium circinans]|uniref:S1 motif domain-containing protein n=1 Tax=Byssothecium circinans TaxID=147558 RepID=A0A6A5TZE1_9PLEO|nr:hypothetical protein CC80DRAFT_37893 [Byssothecium circinans]